MSRSRKAPIEKASYGPKGRKLQKKLANKRVRMETELVDGAMYRKVHDSYDITEYRWFNTDAEITQEVIEMEAEGINAYDPRRK